MANFKQGKGKKEDQIFFTDNLNDADKKRINAEITKSPPDVPNLLQKLFDNDLSVKILWSDYNDSYSVSVTALDKRDPRAGTFYTTFHADWTKALFVLVFLLQDRYDFGDWTTNGVKKFDNEW